VEVERADRLEGAPEALVIRERAVPERSIRRPLFRRGLAARVSFGARHELVARRRSDDGESPHRLGVPCGVHEPEEPAPADPEDVDAAEPEREPHALHVTHQLVLRALLDRHPLRAPVAAVVPEDQPEPERGGEGPERADEAARVCAGPAVEDEARGPVPHDLGVERRPVDPELHARCA